LAGRIDHDRDTGLRAPGPFRWPVPAAAAFLSHQECLKKTRDAGRSRRTRTAAWTVTTTGITEGNIVPLDMVAVDPDP
jgi:hypothetical protein